MRYGSLGENSGLLVSAVGLGCNNFGSRARSPTRAVIDAAIEAGITLFDTADTYGGGGRSEELMGEALTGRRDQIVLATKFGHQSADMGYGPAAGAKGGRRYIRHAVEQSLRRLKTDYIDLYQLHTPDPKTPIAETLAALNELVAEGKVRYFGHSNFKGWQIAEAAMLADQHGLQPFISAQNHWSLLERAAEAEVTPAAKHFGLGVLPYFPLANGLLTGKIRRGQPGQGGNQARGPRGLRDRRQARHRRIARRVGQDPQRLTAADRDRRPGRPAWLRKRHCRGDLSRAGQGQRRRRLNPVRRGTGRGRRDHARAGQLKTPEKLYERRKICAGQIAGPEAKSPGRPVARCGSTYARAEPEACRLTRRARAARMTDHERTSGSWRLAGTGP